jgi:hypothetical protein
VAKHLPLLKHLRTSTVKQRKKLLKKLKPDVIRLISDCALNCLSPHSVVNGALTSKQKVALGKHALELANIAKRGTTIAQKKRIITQTGNGWLIPLLSFGLPFLSNLLSRK